MVTESNLSELVNTDRVRSSVRRLFQNDIKECLAELFQNSQRARARNVEITTRENAFTYRDDGHGILDNLHGFHTLLKIAESDFVNETIEAQDPMGLGIHSLLAHESVRSVTFTSSYYRIAIDTKRWWNDRDYYSNWFKLLEEISEPVEGFQVEVLADEKLVASLKESLIDPYHRYSYSYSRMAESPARGYESYLEITLDGNAIDTSIPGRFHVDSPLIETTYMGSKLMIGFNDLYGAKKSSLIWYGQIIEVPLYSDFQFHLDVRFGRPVNPLSPTRRGLIKDEAYEKLIGFVKDEIFAFVFNPENRSLVTAGYVKACYSLDMGRAKLESPYIVASEILPAEDITSMEDLESRGEPEFFTYEEAPFLLDESVNIIDEDGKVTACEYGLPSFVELTGKSYLLQCGDSERLDVKTLWWKPGAKTIGVISEFFREPGYWGIGTSDISPTEWKEVEKESVFTFIQASNWDFTSVDWTIGTKDVVSFLRYDAWAGFDPESNDSNLEDMKVCYEGSVECLMRKVIGNCVPYLFSVYDLRNFLPTKESRIESVTYHYADDNHAIPEAITAKNSKGEEIRLTLL